VVFSCESSKARGMSSENQSAPLTLERFWRWLSEHPNCVIRAGTPDSTLFDFEDYHWEFHEEEEGHAIAALIRGKNLVGELVIDKTSALFVQSSIDVEAPQSGHWMFEIIGGGKDEPLPVAFFVMSHGLESAAGHQMLKH